MYAELVDAGALACTRHATDAYANAVAGIWQAFFYDLNAGTTFLSETILLTNYIDRIPIEEMTDVIGYDMNQPLPRFQAFPAHMRCEDYIVHRIKRAVRCRWLRFLHIQSCPRQTMLLQGFYECRFINDGTAGRIDDAG